MKGSQVVTNISIIGAGSAAFSLSVIRDLCLTPNLHGSTVHFMDVSQERVDLAHGLCLRYAKEVGAKLDLRKTTDRREALNGTDFVINTALAAGHDRLDEGWAIGIKHGYRFGGSFHIMHDEAFWVNFYQFRLWDALVADMIELCPQAWHLLVANPVLAGVTYLTRKYPQMKVVGHCSAAAAFYGLAKTLGLDREGLTFEIVGVNHHAWLTKGYYRGEDIFPMLERYLDQHAETDKPCGDLSPVHVDLYCRFGVYPLILEGDPWWYHSDPAWDMKKQAASRSLSTRRAKTMAELREVARDPSIKITDRFPPKASGVQMIPIIESIACDIPRVLVDNIQNTGEFLPGIPKDFEAEIPFLVSKRGIQGIQTCGLPHALMARILHERVAPVNMELDAYERGCKESLLQLILMDPWTKSEEQAKALLEDVLSLPYHKELREPYH